MLHGHLLMPALGSPHQAEPLSVRHDFVRESLQPQACCPHAIHYMFEVRCHVSLNSVLALPTVKLAVRLFGSVDAPTQRFVSCWFIPFADSGFFRVYYEHEEQNFLASTRIGNIIASYTKTIEG